MFKRRKNEERTEIDAAWDDLIQTPEQKAAIAEQRLAEAASAFTDPFPEPNEFNLASDTVPTDVSEREAASDVPFDEEDSFAYDAESEEFTSGDASGFLDDSHTDFYSYGEQMHGVHDTPEDPSASVPEASAAVVGSYGKHGSGRSSKQAAYDAMPEHQKQSRRVRRVLRVVIALLLALLAALAYFGVRLYQESRLVAEQEVVGAHTEVEEAAGTEEVSQDAATANVKKTDIPELLPLLGLSSDDAIEKLGHGATITLDTEVTDAQSPMTNRLTVVLTDEPADAKSGAPTVHLGMDADGKVVTAGYSAATASLGYGTLSFVDAVANERVVEKTLEEAGLSLDSGSVVLPSADSYSSFAADGTTLVKEQCTFDGQQSQDGKDYLWTSVLVYNYTAANATGNLADTVRQIYVYVSEKDASEAAISAKAQAAKEKEEKDNKDKEAESSEAKQDEKKAEDASAGETESDAAPAEGEDAGQNAAAAEEATSSAA